MIFNNIVLKYINLGFCFIGIGLIVFGYIIDKYQLDWIISSYNHKKYDKQIICRLVGKSNILMGLTIVAFTIIYYFTKQYISYIVYFVILVLITLTFILGRQIYFKKYIKKQ